MLPSCSAGTLSKLPVSTSVLIMVPVAVPLAIVPPFGSVRRTSNVSPLSLMVSSMIGIAMVLRVSPGWNVSVPLFSL